MELEGKKERGTRMHFVVVVLGDVGRSPRMQYHAASLLEEGHFVSLVGYEGSNLIPALDRNQENLHIIRFTVPSADILKNFLPLYMLWRIISLSIYVLHALFFAVARAKHSREVDCILVQNPPAVPLLLLAHCYCVYSEWFKGCRPRLVIDWHNLGFTMLSNPTISRVARTYEQVMAPLATSHLCVTSAMKTFLESFGVPKERIHVLYDCPPSMFQPIPVEQQHQLLSRLHNSLCAACPSSWHQHLDPSKQTLFTEVNDAGNCVPRFGRPALITSSTSWTPDEDFGTLLEAVKSLDARISERQSSLRVLVVVTGRGPQRQLYQEQMSRLQMQNVAIQTLWMEPVDYPLLLACADLGVSLHTSTSGIDLPMKILDLYGCGVPVCARNFRCLPELVQDDENGRVFESSSELEQHLWYLLSQMERCPEAPPPHGFGELQRYSQALRGRARWGPNWKANALPTLEGSPSTSAASPTPTMAPQGS